MGQYSADFLNRNWFRFCVILCIGACSVRFSSAQSKSGKADLIITNAHVYTVNAKQPNADAIAIRQHHVLAVGSAADMKRWSGPHTKTIDAQGRLVLPGFYDSHIHFMEGALSLEKVNVDDTKTV